MERITSSSTATASLAVESRPVELVAPSDAATVSTPSNSSDRSSISNDADPLLLASRLQTQEHLQKLRQRKKHRKQGKVVSQFYEKQNKQIEALLMTMDQHIENAQEEEDTNRLAVRSRLHRSRFRG